MVRDVRYYKAWWKKYGAMILVLCMLPLFWLSDNHSEAYLPLAVLYALFLTVPCGFKIVNSNKFIWFGRQMLFLAFSMSCLASYLKL